MLWAAAALFVAAATPDSFNERLQRGIEETRRGEFANAMIDLRIAQHLDARSPEVYLRLGLLLAQMSDFRDAESAFRRAVELQPSFAQAHYNLGLTLIADPQNKLDWPAAISSFKSALQYRPDFAEAANYLGAGLLATGNADGAAAQFERAIRINPSLAEAHFNLGLALERKERAADAESEYRRAIALRPAYPEALVALGKLLLRNGSLAEAKKQVKVALRLNPDLRDGHYALAQVAQAAKDRTTARVEFEQVSELEKRKSDAAESARSTNEGLQLAAKGEMSAALRSEREAVALKPDYGVPHYNLALILADCGELDAAARELIKASSLMPGNAAPWFDLGRVWIRRGEVHDALMALEWAKRLAPADERIARELSGLRQNSESIPEVPHPPFGPAADTASEHLTFASKLQDSGDELGAIGELLRALALEPGNDKARQDLAGAYRRLKLNQEAALEQAKLDLIGKP